MRIGRRELTAIVIAAAFGLTGGAIAAQQAKTVTVTLVIEGMT